MTTWQGKCRGFTLCGFGDDCPFDDDCQDDEALSKWAQMEEHEKQEYFESQGREQ